MFVKSFIVRVSKASGDGQGKEKKRMIFLFSVVVVLLLGLSQAQSISIVDRNTPDIKTRLISAQFTDFLPRKVTLYAVDYFRLSSTLNTTANLTIASFTFATLRSRSDRDPESLTLVLFYKNTSTGIDIPAATPFFSKRVNAPGEPPEWQNASMTDVVYIQVNISNGDKSEHDASVIFDLANASLLPRDTLMWVGFYMTGSRNHSFETGLDNCLYWVMNNNTQVDNATTTNESDSFFYHLDSGNTASHSLECWNNASAVATKFRINTSSHQMAWTLRLLGDDSTSYFDYYMKRMGTKELVIIVFASIAGFIVLCVCSCWCVRKCRLVSLRRRKRSQQGDNNTSKGVDNLNTSFYSPVYSPKDVISLEVWSTDDASSLDAPKQQHSVRFDDIPIGTTETTTTTQGKKYTPAGRFINNLQKETKFT